MTPVDLVNQALDRIMWPGNRVADFYDGTFEANVALRLYGQVRDNLFGLKDWPFLRRSINLGSPIKTAPVNGYGTATWNPVTNPPLPWLYEYLYPDDCIEVRSVRPVPSVLPELTPVPNIFVAAFDGVSGAKVVLTNLINAQAVITARVINPDEWQDSNFVESLVDSLSVVFAKALKENLNVANMAKRDAMIMTELADDRRG